MRMLNETGREQFRDVLWRLTRRRLDGAPTGEGRSSARAFASALFNEWFTIDGRATFFLFRKNLGVTNIQFGELMALVRSEVRSSHDQAVPDIQFAAPEEFIRSFERIVEGIGDSAGAALPEVLADIYWPLVNRVIVIRPFYSSAVVFVPPHLRLDTAAVCGYSGYVHSCGPRIYIRRVDKADAVAFEASLRDYLDTRLRLKADERVIFAPYSHEDFTQYDRDFADQLRSGLDDVKLHVEKFFLGNDRLVTFLNDLREKERRLLIPAPGDYRRRHAELRQVPGTRTDRTWWLILDRCTSSTVKQPGEHRYFVCYDQEYKNESPYHIFDEAKPAWTAPITVPHTLAGAMVNLTRPDWPPTAGFCDPFVGSGTVWMEASKYPQLNARCSDLSEISPRLCIDNLRFFEVGTEELAQLRDRLTSLAVAVESGASSRDDLLLEEAKRRFAGLANFRDLMSMKDVTFDRNFVKELGEARRFDRLLFYLVVRTTVRHLASFIRRHAEADPDLFDSEWTHSWTAEVKQFTNTIQHLIDMRRRQKDLESTQDRPELLIGDGEFSKTAVVVRTLDGDWNKYLTDVWDACKLAERGQVDVIVTDPPYGFNTEEDPVEFARFYSKAIPALVRALKAGGQLVVCLPDQSFNGRKMFFFTQRDLVVQQVLLAAAELGISVRTPSYAVPEPVQLFRPPYYWESERALRRAILHFRFEGEPASLPISAAATASRPVG